MDEAMKALVNYIGYLSDNVVEVVRLVETGV